MIHWQPTQEQMFGSEDEDALDSGKTTKKFFYAQEYFIDQDLGDDA